MDTSTTSPATASDVNIRVYNTLSKTKEPLKTVVPGKVGIYLCGPTVYKEAHIGHMVGPVIFDTIKRYLVYCGYEVCWVVNITDVDDKLIGEAVRRGIPMSQVAEENTQDYLQNLQALGVDQIDEMPRATDNIDEIIRFVQSLVEREFAYESEGDVFFDVTRDAEYGKLSNRSAEEQQGEGGGAAAKKKSPGDFALWKAAKPGEPSWDSPWGPGRPGWHIECSAMSRRLLGETFDIHGGGLDLVFPHHENELAQSECCHGKPMVNYWMHNGLMRAAAAGKVGGRGERESEQATVDTKISRSKGAGGLADLISRQGGEPIRFFLLRTHYRSTIVFSEEGVAEAGTALEAFHRLFERYERVTGESFYALPVIERRSEGEWDPGEDPLLKEVHASRRRFLAKMDDDFNTGGAVSDLFDLVRSLNKFMDSHQLEEPQSRESAHIASLKRAAATVRELSALLGIFREAPPHAGGDDQLVGQLVELFIQLRSEARAKKDFATADRIRDGLAERGVKLEDRKDGTGWRLE
jgi:cysteinyl-tRNA synthetase